MTHSPEEMWAWAHEEVNDDDREVDPSSVVAILVAHNGDQWLPRTLLGLARMTPRPGTLLAVDAGSTDDTHRILSKSLDEGLINLLVDARAQDSYGDCVNAALAEYHGSARWLWLLHDDAVPRSDCLEALLIAGDTPGSDGRKPSILVPKLLHPKRRNHPDQMRAVGESITQSGMRVLTVEPGDIDQHQEEPGPVLGASTAGMLIDLALWRELGGTRDFVPLFRDGVDLGWRANARGLLVRTCPQAAMRHSEAGRVGLRESVIAPDSAQFDLAAGMAVAAAHAADPRKALRKMSRSSYLRAFGFLLGKSPSLAQAQLKAAEQARSLEPQILAAWEAESKKLAKDATDPELLPARGSVLKRVAESVAGAISDRYYDFVDNPESEGMLDELTGDEFAGGTSYRRFLAPAILGLIIMTIAILVASRQLIGFAAGPLSGPALFPAPESIGVAWSAWAKSSPGLDGGNAPWLLFAALAATVSFGQPDIAISVLILGGPAFAALAAFRFLQPVCGKGYITMLLAMLWGVSLPVLGVTGWGMIDATVLAILLPGIARNLRSWQTSIVEGPQGWRVPAALAISLVILTSLLPLSWLAALTAGVWFGFRRSDLRGGLIVALSPVVTWLPWLPRLVNEPGRLLVGADPGAHLATEAPSVWVALTGAWTGTPLWLGTAFVGLVWLTGAVGAARTQGISRKNFGILLFIAAVFPALGVACNRLVVTVAGVPVRPSPTPGVLIGVLALIILSAYGLGHTPNAGAGGEDEPKNPLLRRLIAGLTAAGVLLGGAWWVSGALSPLDRQHDVMPSYVTGVQSSWRATRTLMIDMSLETASYGLTDAQQPTWGSGEALWPLGNDQADTEVVQLAQQFAQGQPSDNLAARLASLGIGHVWLRGAGAERISALSSTPDLNAATADDTTVIFTVSTQPAFASLIKNGGEVSYPTEGEVLPNNSADILVLATPVDGSWQVRVGDTRLKRTDSPDWRQAFALNGATGKLVITRSVSWWAVIWEVVCWLALILMVSPTSARVSTPRRAAGAAKAGRRSGDE